MSRLDRALYALLSEIEDGEDYPYARDRVARVYDVDSEDLAYAFDRALYDHD